MAVPADLDDVLAGLERTFGATGPALGTVCARVALRTGVDLRAPRPGRVADPRALAAVLAALADLGLAP